MTYRIEYFDALDSTNDLLLEMAKNGEKEGKVIVAETQTSGHGRLGRSYESPEGGLYMSMLVKTSQPLLLTSKAAVAVKRALFQTCLKEVAIKWVNDLYYKGKKVAGILAQGAGDLTVVGVGINLWTDKKAFSPSIRNSATSLFDDRKTCNCSLKDLAVSVADNMFALSNEKGKGTWLDEYRESSLVLGRKVDVFKTGIKVFEGRVTGIDDNCALHVLDNKNEEMILFSGEVSLRMNDD